MRFGVTGPRAGWTPFRSSSVQVGRGPVGRGSPGVPRPWVVQQPGGILRGRAGSAGSAAPAWPVGSAQRLRPRQRGWAHDARLRGARRSLHPYGLTSAAGGKGRIGSTRALGEGRDTASSLTSDRSGVPGDVATAFPIWGFHRVRMASGGRSSTRPEVSPYKPKPRIVALAAPTLKALGLEGTAGGASKQAMAIRRKRLEDRPS